MTQKKEKTLFFTLLFLFLTCIYFFYYENDYYWHLKVGEWIIENKSIPKIDVFSWYASSQNLVWIAHEWLFEVVIYIFNLLFSNIGALIFVILSLTIIFIIIWNTSKDYFIEYPLKSIVWILFSLFIFSSKAIPRPHLISFILFAITVYISKITNQNEKSKLIWFTPIISIIWANIHGGSSNLSYLIYGYNFLFCFIKDPKISSIKTKKFLYATISSIILILLNPYGIEMIIYPYKNMTYTTMLNCIDEWHSLSIKSIEGIIYIPYIIYIIYTLIIKSKERKIFDIILCLIFIILGIKSTRMMPYLFIIANSIIPKYWTNNKIEIRLTPILILSVFILSFSIYKLINYNMTYKRISNEIINYLKVNENIILYNSYNLGGYLIYKNIPVFIDGRADIYANTILCDVCEIEKGKNPKLIENYPFNTFIVEKKTTIHNYLKNNSKYKLILTDKYNSVYIINPEN